VLVADDDPTIVLLLEHALEGLGREYDTASSGDAAWALWEEKKHELAILDIEMPGMDGLEICRRIRQAQPEGERRTFVMMVTGRDRAADLEAGLDAGADDYVSKPTTGPQLVARLRIAQRRMEEDRSRREMQEELQRARWMAGVGEAMVTLQHEINNPLAGLLATAEWLQIEAEEAGRPSKELRVIVDQARRLSALVRRLAEVRDPKSVTYVGAAKMVDLGKSAE
jgi:DNA-binding response OmpR family regulator